ncbi:cupin domain-containing protein [Psychroflexus tropicus]|uniref:cupin domain-containing protein n=1 Tax=Psychroflexus tropicus TaxID=197345 RepID=UPI00035D0465|nr:cupin domain-containing protein [Psychroflexus tropicus]
MKIASLNEALDYNDNKPAIQVLLETKSSKEIRIVFQKGQIMKEHKTPFPIVVEVFKGSIVFGVHGGKHELKQGSIIALDGGIPHELKATENSIVRLSLSKNDKVSRVKNINTSAKKD